MAHVTLNKFVLVYLMQLIVKWYLLYIYLTGYKVLNKKASRQEQETTEFGFKIKY